MLGGYVTVAVLIELGLIPCLKVDLPCWQGLLEETTIVTNTVPFTFPSH